MRHEHESFARLLRLYLDPFAFFKSVTHGSLREQADALQYNCRQRGLLLAYARRWAVIAIASGALLAALCPLARAEPILIVPIIGLDLVFDAAFLLLVLCVCVYFVLGLQERGR